MTLKYTVIGGGGHAIASHIQPSRSLGFELLGVYDPAGQNASEAIEASDCPRAKACASVDELLALPEVQAVVITSPDEFHPEQLEQAVQAGLHVLVDKPLAVDEAGLAIVRAALDHAAKQGLVVASCHPRRSDPPYLWIKDNLPELVVLFGRLVRVEMDFSYHRPVATWKMARSLLLDHFPHEIDFLRWLLGDEPFQAYRLADGSDSYSVAGWRADGVQFIFSGTRRLESTIYPEEVRLRFSRGTCAINTSSGLIAAFDHEMQAISERYERVVTDYDGRFTQLAREFARAVQDGASDLLDPGLILNTASAIALAKQGMYSSMRDPR